MMTEQGGRSRLLGSTGRWKILSRQVISLAEQYSTSGR